jgi:fatty-acyl-CoA synthase
MRISPRPDLSVISEDLRILNQPGEEGILSRRGHMPWAITETPRKRPRPL